MSDTMKDMSHGAMRREMADEITRLRAEIEAARKVIEPFADEAVVWAEWGDDEELVEPWNGGPDTNLRVGHLRAARKWMEGNSHE
jgi:hypothetical protein